MDNNKKIYLFFIVIFLIIWNPLSLIVLYKGTEIPDIRLIKYLYWFTLISGICVFVLIKMNKFKNSLRNITLYLLFTGIVFKAAVLLNLLLGVMLPNEYDTKRGLIFKPNTNAYYKTVDFDFTANINSIGLRDNEISIDKGNKFRIACFGDSWTFGWGVQLEYSWPKRLEILMKEKGFANVEVINCAKGGDLPSGYKNKIEPVITLLNPDLILVGVLQANDFDQSFNSFIRSESKTLAINRGITYISKWSLKYLSVSFNNFIKLLVNDYGEGYIIEDHYKSMVAEQISSFNDYQKMRYYTIDDTLKYLFTSGNLNPSLLWEYLNFPENYFIMNDPKNAATIAAANQIRQEFREIKNLCDKYSTDVIYINLPETAFIGHKVIRSSLVNNLNYYLTNNNNIDSIHKSIADELNITYYQLTERFKQLEDKTAYFFKYDGHPNQKGYDEMAKGICDFLINEYHFSHKIKKD